MNRYEQFWEQLREQVQQNPLSQLGSGLRGWSRPPTHELPPVEAPAEPLIARPPEPPRRIGLALGGGGGKGGAHLGVLQVLEELGVTIDVIAGTSIGGAVGILYAAGFSLAEIAEIFQLFTMRRIAATDPSRMGFIGSRKRETMLREVLGDRTFADLRIPCAVVAADLITGREVVIDEGPLVPAILATTALPGVFPPEVRGEELLVDGGILNNVPADVAAEMGAQRVIAVVLRDAPFSFEPTTMVPANPLARLMLAPRQFAIANRALSMMIDQTTELRLAQSPPAIQFVPDVGHISMLDMSRVGESHRAGEEVARAAVDDLRALQAWRAAPPEVEPLPAPMPSAAPLPLPQQLWNDLVRRARA